MSESATTTQQRIDAFWTTFLTLVKKLGGAWGWGALVRAARGGFAKGHAASAAGGADASGHRRLPRRARPQHRPEAAAVSADRRCYTDARPKLGNAAGPPPLVSACGPDSRKLLRIVQVREGPVSVVEARHRDPEPREPAVHAAPAGGEVGIEARGEVRGQQRVQGVLTLGIGGDGEVRRRVRGERGGEPRSEIDGEPRRIAGAGQEPGRLDDGECRRDARERPLEAVEAIGDDVLRERGVLLGIAVGADPEPAHLRAQPLCRPVHQRAAVERDQALIAPAHAPPRPTGQDQPGQLIKMHRSLPEGQGPRAEGRGPRAEDQGPRTKDQGCASPPNRRLTP
jgi:hypothetical protein